MRIRVLGSGAGGGFPQWNCNCANCDAYRKKTLDIPERTQSSITISENGSDWILINASPDIRAQLARFPAMQPARHLRDTAIKAVVLVDAQIDHCSGLLFLREGEKLPVYCTKAVQEDLTGGLPLFSLLQHYCGTEIHTIPIDKNSSFSIDGASHLEFQAITLSGKAPPYSPHRQMPQPGDNIALMIKDKRHQKSLFYAPGIQDLTNEIHAYLEQADCILIDGTFWTEDEMITAGVGKALAHEMGHCPQSGENGMIEALKQHPNARRILIHINNTNPILNSHSEAFHTLTQNGIEVSFDGMEINLE
jgi:pyrroloquinoline quinone biosynthesis protein B